MVVGIRFEGTRAEVERLVEQMRAGVPVQVETRTVKARREGFVHVYAVAVAAPGRPQESRE